MKKFFVILSCLQVLQISMLSNSLMAIHGGNQGAQNPMFLQDLQDPPIKTQDEVTKQESQLTDNQEELATKLLEEHWQRIDRNKQLRVSQTRLWDKHQAQTRAWVLKLEEDEADLLLDERPPREAANQVRDLKRKYKQVTDELFEHYKIADRLALKIVIGHWEGMERTGIRRESYPQFTIELENAVADWFHNRSMEDLKIFEKAKPNANERNRGEKITTELLQTIDAVKQRHNMGG